MNQKNLNLQNTDIAYLDNELNTEKCILFIHGNSLNANTFRNQFSDAQLNQYRLIAIDLPGHGDSALASKPEETYSVLNYADLIVEFVNELNLKNVILAGHSLGGHIAIEASEQINNCIGLVIFGTPPIGMPPAMADMFLPNPAINYAYTGDLTTEEAKTLAAAFAPAEYKLEKAILNTDPNARVYLGASIGQGKFKDELAICSSARFPIAIFHGEGDALINLDYLNNLTFPIWKDKVHVIRDSTHCPQLENPDDFNAKLSELIDLL